MPPKVKRPYNKTRRKTYAKYGGKAVAAPAARTLQAAIKRVLNKNIETKQSNSTNTDNVLIAHNNFISVDNTVLATSPGVNDPTTLGVSNRIGDEINLKGVAFKFMLENNARYSDVTFRIMVIKCAKGDTPTTATLFNGLSGNKMMDTFNNERFTLLFSKYVKLKQGSQASSGQTSLGAGFIGSGVYNANQDAIISASTKIVKFWIPGTKFVSKGLVRYENGTAQVKFYDYHVLVYAYAVGATSSAIGWDVGLCNEYIKQMYYKDA